jgi:5-methylcytosine-specific restriction endonuclease McrBC regulatory subunit McrC
LFAHQEGPFGKRHDLRPDIVITLNSEASKEILILDTKWKIYDEKNAQVAQADLYQLFAYANYWAKPGYQVHVALIAPEAVRLSTPSTHAYTPRGKYFSTPLSMLPYDLIELDALITPIDHVHFESSVTFRHLFNIHNFEPQ